MAEIKNRIKGMDFDEFIATRRGVQFKLETKARFVTSRARGVLADHRYEGHSYIYRDKGRIDHYIIMADRNNSNSNTASKGRHGHVLSAMSIEFGREPGPDGRGGMAGIFPLSRGAGIRGY